MADADPADDSETADLAWRTTGSETEYTCPGFAVRRDDVILPDGTETDFHSVEDPPAVVILPFTPDGDEADTLRYLFAVEPANGLLDSVHHYYLARGCEPTAERDLDFNESIRVEVTDYDDLLAAVLDGTIRDGRTVVGVTRYELAERWR